MLLLPTTSAILAFGPPLTGFDHATAVWFRAHLTPGAATAWEVATTAGCEIWITSLLVFTIILLTWWRRWYGLLTLVLAVPGGALLGQGIKDWVQRPRPYVAGPWGQWGGYSFPSGHTIAATLLYGFLAITLMAALRARGLGEKSQPARPRRFRRWAPAIGAAAVIAAVGCSRIALGAHYVSDVLGAMALGTGWLGLCVGGVGLMQRRLTPAPRLPVPQTTEELPTR